MSQFSQMDEVNQAYLMLHETLHSFLAMDLQFRNNKLRSLVKAIRRNEVSPTDHAEFAMQFKQSEAQFDWDETPRYGFSLQDYLDSGFGRSGAALYLPCDTLKKLGFTAEEVVNAIHCPAESMAALGFSKQEILESGLSIRGLLAAGIPLSELKSKFTVKQFRKEWFSGTELRAAGFTAAELGAESGGTDDYDVKFMKVYGYSAKELKDAGYPIPDMVKEFSRNELEVAGFSLRELLEAVGVSWLEGRYSASEFRAAGVSAADLREHYRPGDLLNAGYSKKEVRQAYGFKWYQRLGH